MVQDLSGFYGFPSDFWSLSSLVAFGSAFLRSLGGVSVPIAFLPVLAYYYGLRRIEIEGGKNGVPESYVSQNSDSAQFLNQNVLRF